MTREVKMVYFAWVRERLGRDGEAVLCPDDIQTVGQLVDHLRQREMAYEGVFADLGKLRFALDQNFVTTDAALGNAAELAVFPPVTGG